MYDYFNQVGNIKIDSLMNYIMNNSYKEETIKFSFEEYEDDVVKNLINSCDSYLNTLFKNEEKFFSLNKLYKDNSVSKKNGIFIIRLEHLLNQKN